jgi:hypothetical protein
MWGKKMVMMIENAPDGKKIEWEEVAGGGSN